MQKQKYILWWCIWFSERGWGPSRKRTPVWSGFKFELNQREKNVVPLPRSVVRALPWDTQTQAVSPSLQNKLNLKLEASGGTVQSCGEIDIRADSPDNKLLYTRESVPLRTSGSGAAASVIYLLLPPLAHCRHTWKGFTVLNLNGRKAALEVTEQVTWIFTPAEARYSKTRVCQQKFRGN